MRYFGLLLVGLLILVSCKKESNFQDYDLIQHGLSIKIKAPLNPEVSVTDMGIAKDVTVKKGEDFSIQILSSSVTTYDTQKIIAEKKKEVLESKYFSEIVLENERGFVFEKKIDEDNINYDFRSVKILGDTEYDFQIGLVGKFTKEAAIAMFEAVQ